MFEEAASAPSEGHAGFGMCHEDVGEDVDECGKDWY